MSKYFGKTLADDDSWIRKADNEDPDANMGKVVLSHYKSSETLSSPDKTTPTRSSSVQALAKRFSASQDDLTSSNYPSGMPSYTRSTSRTFTEEPKSSTTTTTVSKNGTSETTITTTTQTIRSPTTQTFNERVWSSSKGAEDKLYDTLIPSSIRDDYSPTNSNKSVFTSKTVTVQSNPDVEGLKSTTISRASTLTEDQLYDTLLPKSMTSPVSEQSSTVSSSSFTRRTSSYSSYTDDMPSKRSSTYSISSTGPSDDYSSDQKRYSFTSYSSITSPTASTNTYRTSRSDDILSDPFYTKSSSVKSTYASTDRLVLERDMCTYCHKPLNDNPKMILSDMKINCHASCFKCEVCNSTLGDMKAGDSIWIYRRMVHCENCFDITREKWRQ